MSAHVFIGPSLPPQLRPAHPGLVYRPPARRGDIVRAVLDGAAVIGLIDGLFEAAPAVWHAELLWALEQGITVSGAASLGALRAAELADFGMTGIGEVYAAYRSGQETADDAVAVLHGPHEAGSPQLTEALVDVEATLAAAAHAGVITGKAARRLASAARKLFFKQRTWGAVLAYAGKTDRRALLAWLPSGRISLKQQDALACIRWLIDTGTHAKPAGSHRPPPPGSHLAWLYAEVTAGREGSPPIPAQARRCNGWPGARPSTE